ncbi:MAG: rhomboid family intramembrane serine protease [Pirellula sp.]|jgi:rhomboid protease GluP
MMNNPENASQLDQLNPIIPARPESIRSTWATSIACLTCIGIFIGINSVENVGSWDTLSKFGHLSPNTIWSGHWWGLVTTAFVHMELWHVAFNVYWGWALGSRMERSVGTAPYLAFFIASAFVSSAFQLAVSDTTGIGASGVVYAMFGFMWTTRGRYALFGEVLSNTTILLFIVWLFFCVATTMAEILVVGNAAHFSGLFFGGCVGMTVVSRTYRRLAFAVTSFILLLSVAILFWCPWSVTWSSIHAYDAQIAGRYSEAIDHYTRIIRLDPKNSWAFQNRSSAYLALGENEKAQEDMAKAIEIDSMITKE